MKTATTNGLYKVMANGTESVPMSKRQAEKIARWLREGNSGRAMGHVQVAATVVPA